jgi:hypothetical protein
VLKGGGSALDIIVGPSETRRAARSRKRRRIRARDARRALSPCERLALAAGEPFLPPETRDLLVRDLMQARRAVLTARRSGSLDDLSAAHARIDAAKRTLGERGPVW